MALLLLKKNNCVKLFWNPCKNIEVMTQTSWIYDHFIIWPLSMSLTCNLHEQMFQLALLLHKDSNCAKLFWNPCINVQLMSQTSSIYDHFIIWPSSVTMTFLLPEQMSHKVCTMHTHTPNCSCKNSVSLTTVGWHKNYCQGFRTYWT